MRFIIIAFYELYHRLHSNSTKIIHFYLIHNKNWRLGLGPESIVYTVNSSNCEHICTFESQLQTLSLHTMHHIFFSVNTLTSLRTVNTATPGGITKIVGDVDTTSLTAISSEVEPLSLSQQIRSTDNIRESCLTRGRVYLVIFLVFLIHLIILIVRVLLIL